MTVQENRLIWSLKSVNLRVCQIFKIQKQEKLNVSGADLLCSDGYSLVGRYTDGLLFCRGIAQLQNSDGHQVQLNQPKGHQKPRLQMQSDVLPRYMTLCCCFFPLFFKKFEAGPFFWCFSGPKTITKECVHTESTTDVAWLPWGRMPHQNKQEVFLANLSSWTASTHGWVCLFS